MDYESKQKLDEILQELKNVKNLMESLIDKSTSQKNIIIQPNNNHHNDNNIIKENEGASLDNKILDTKVIDWLEKCQIKVEKENTQEDPNKLFDDLAIELGKNYEILKDLLNKIKVHISTTKHIILNLSGKSPDEINIITQFCIPQRHCYFI